MILNFDQQKALARFVHTIRSDWDVAGIIAALGDARTYGKAGDVRAIADAAVAAALDVRNRTPAVIPLAGPHWQARTSTPPVRRLDPLLTCGICSLDEDTCRRATNSGHEFESYNEVRAKARPARERRRSS